MRLDGPSLAWEYLRRNPEYRSDWTRRNRENCDPASRWHLEVLEDPDLDARLARPIWRLGRDQRIRLQAADSLEHGTGDVHCFSLWEMPGAKRLVHTGNRMLLTGYAHGEVLNLTIGQDIQEGTPFDFVIGPGADMEEAMRGHERQRRFATGQKRSIAVATARPDRLALLHKRALQAFDGRVAGASQREIARHLFGDESVARNWNPDSELRAQVRHLLRRARAFVAAGYRDLIAKPALRGR